MQYVPNIHVVMVHWSFAQEEVTEFILKSASSVREMRRELKTWQKAKTKEISDKLMDMNERNCSVEQLIKEREECLKAVTTERNELLVCVCAVCAVVGGLSFTTVNR